MSRLKDKFRFRIVRHGMFFSLSIEALEIYVLYAVYKSLELLLNIFLDKDTMINRVFYAHRTIILVLVCAFGISRTVRRFLKIRK